jgi:hypothetical protein
MTCAKVELKKNLAEMVRKSIRECILYNRGSTFTKRTQCRVVKVRNDTVRMLEQFDFKSHPNKKLLTKMGVHRGALAPL